MSKSGKNPDLSIRREVTQTVITSFMELLNSVKTDDEFSMFAIAYQKESFLSKYVDESTDSPDVRKHRAIVKWLSVERRNRNTNKRIFTSSTNFNGVGDAWTLLRKASSYILDVLGREPPLDLLSFGSFSGGASTSRKRDAAVLFSKFTGVLDVTPSCWVHLEPVIKDIQTWITLTPEALQPRFVKGNIMFTVPKTSIIDRVACKEPDGNIFCQKAVGDFIRRRLKTRARIDLNDQSKNRHLAYSSSRDNRLATIDLSSASDSLTDSLVRSLLPPKWYTLLDDLRCRKTFIDGSSHVNEMFSSMGNGFTFELESLVFWAVARATCHLSGSKGRISVYGDDIIVPRSSAPMLITVLNWIGFKVNVDKTFIKGPFRESCGGHYYRGLDVTPIYLRRPFKDVSDVILFMNQLRGWIIRTAGDTIHGFDCDGPFVALWKSLLGLVPKYLHGGYDLSVRTQLVTIDNPRLKLVEKLIIPKRTIDTYQTGMYLQRLASTEFRKEPSIDDPSSLSIPTGKWTIRRAFDYARVFGAKPPMFWSEHKYLS